MTIALHSRSLTTDPIYLPKAKDSAFDRFFSKFINDKRDLPFVYFILQANVVVIPFAAYLFVPGAFRWWLAVAYLAVALLGFMDRYILILHNTSHRPLFKPRYGFLNKYLPWVLGPFFGETPETYFAHHLGMHHPENNLPDDLSSTMRYQRDSLWHWLRYYQHFFWGILFELTAYMWKRRRYRLIRRMLCGEFAFYALVATLCFVNWRATLVVFVIPFLLARFLMMAGNWAQHAFVDASDPANCFKNSLTVINCRYNRRCFNDGYHIGHHRKANRHWTEMPVEFEQDRAQYAANQAIVFEGIDFFVVWALLMLKRYDVLARHFVRLGRDLSDEQVIALLKDRTRRIDASAEPARSSRTTAIAA